MMRALLVGAMLEAPDFWKLPMSSTKISARESSRSQSFILQLEMWRL